MGFSNCGSWPTCVLQSRTRWVTQSQLAAAKFAFQWHTSRASHFNDTAQSRAARYTNINYELRYCLAQFFNHKGRDLKHELRVLKPGCALVAITEMVSEWRFIKGSVCIIDEKKLAHFTALCSAWDCINREILTFQKLFQVCSFSSISSVWTWHCLSFRDILYIFCVYLKRDTFLFITLGVGYVRSTNKMLNFCSHLILT